jgi:hypothetical protein
LLTGVFCVNLSNTAHAPKDSSIAAVAISYLDPSVIGMRTLFVTGAACIPAPVFHVGIVNGQNKTPIEMQG